MIDDALDGRVAAIENSLASGIQNQLELAFKDDVEIDAESPVHGRRVARRQFDDAEDDTLLENDSRRVVDQTLVGLQVAVLSHCDREGLAAVAEYDPGTVGEGA